MGETGKSQGRGSGGRARIGAGLIAVGVVALGPGTAHAAGPAGGAPRIDAGLIGAKPATTRICGAKRRAFTAEQGKTVMAKVRLKHVAPRERQAKPRLTLTVERCVGRRWSKPRRARTERIKPGRLATLTLDTSAVGDVRLRALAQIGSKRVRSRFVYLRVAPSQAPIVEAPVTFTVKNLNRSAISCASDGKEYRIAGRIVGPASLGKPGSGPTTVTLYLHEFSFGKFFWNFPDPAYDYAAAQARAGHVSVIVDRLGYDESPGPHGRQICIGSQADMAHQMVGQLRSGTYASTGLPPRSFGRVALTGHSIGGMIAELAAYSFKAIDALIIFAWADQGYSAPSLYSAFGEQGSTCTRGGEPAEPGGSPAYAYTTPTRESFIEHVFFDAEPAIVERTADMRNRDPCGDVSSQPAAIASNTSRIDEIAVPVLLVYGENDWIFDQPGAGERQKAAFAGSKDVTMHMLARTGHALTLERTAPRTREIVSGWLAQRGL